MKVKREANTVRLNCQIRADIKAAMEGLVEKRYREEGGYVGFTRVINEACLLLLGREGIAVDPNAPPPRKPAKPSPKGRKAAAA